jgi:hypothetical protein
VHDLKVGALPRILPKFFLVLLFAVLICVSAAAQSVQVANGKVIGPGYQITLPDGVNVSTSVNPESAHGFYLALPPEPADVPARPLMQTYRYIAFSTRWDLGDMPSLDAAVNSITGNIAGSVPSYIVNSGEIVVDGNFPARLGTIPARRLVLKFRNKHHDDAIRQVIVAYDTRKDASAIVYFLVLNTTEQNFEEDLGVFGKILRGFKVTGQ